MRAWVFLAALLLLAACGGPKMITHSNELTYEEAQQIPYLNEETGEFELPGEYHEVSVEMFKYGFKPAELELPYGKKIRLTATSTDGEHGLAIPHFEVDTGVVPEGE